MSDPALHKTHYQGPDWETRSWPVARAYDLVSRIQDLCLYQTNQEDFEIVAEGYNILRVVAEMIDDLRSQLAMLEADLYPSFTEKHLAPRWHLFEARQILREVQNYTTLATHIHKQSLMSQEIEPEDEENMSPYAINCAALFEQIHSRSARIRELIKLVDLA